MAQDMSNQPKEQVTFATAEDTRLYWVALKDGRPMPPNNEWVLIYTGKAPVARLRRVWAARRMKLKNGPSFWETDTDEGVIAKNVSHWMPMIDVPEMTP